MRPRREIFAFDYIEDTVRCYQRIVESDALLGQYDTDELIWAFDVLSAFFDTVPQHPKVDPLRDLFHKLPAPTIPGHPRRGPYIRQLAQTPPVKYDDLLKLAHHRRSVRWFLPKPVPREAIDRAIIVAGLSPSACNRQPYVFRVFDDPTLVTNVACLPYGAEGYNENIPTIIVVVGQLRCYFDERDRHLIYIDSSLASMGLLYALESQGLSACCINWPDVADRERTLISLLAAR